MWNENRVLSSKVISIKTFFTLVVLFYIVGHSSSKLTVHQALSYYSVKYTDHQNGYHVTACYSPRGKYLAGSPYHKSPAVEKAVGQISYMPIIGWVITRDTLSARVSLTKKQRALWLNDDERSRGSLYSYVYAPRKISPNL